MHLTNLIRCYGTVLREQYDGFDQNERIDEKKYAGETPCCDHEHLVDELCHLLDLFHNK